MSKPGNPVKKVDPLSMKLVMVTRICGIGVLLTKSAVLVASDDIGLDRDDDCDNVFTEDVTFIDAGGLLLNYDACQTVQSYQWCLFHKADYPFTDEFYQLLYGVILSFGRFVTGVGVVDQLGDGTGERASLLSKDEEAIPKTLSPIGWAKTGFFALAMYDSFAVSRSTNPKAEGNLYLSTVQILDYWDRDVLRRTLNADHNDSISSALSTRTRSFCSSLETGTLKAVHRFQLVNRSDLPSQYCETLSERVTRLAFYPYSTLKSIGLPKIARFEDAIRKGVYGLKQS